MKTPAARRFAPALCLLACAALPACSRTASSKPARKAPPAAPADQDMKSIYRLKQMAVMLEMYVQDNDDAYPPMKTPAQVRKSLMPYDKVPGPEVFLQPGTGRPYLSSPLLSGSKVTDFKDLGGIMTFYEPVPAADGSRLISTADGRIRRISKSNWAGYKRATHLP